MSLFSELKRRNVFRVALLYVVASWVVMQVADVGVSLLGLPVTTGRLVFLLLAVGFPLVMLFSWAYEITPDGLKKEKEVDRSASVTHQTARKLDTAVIVLLVIAIAGLALDRFIPQRAAETAETVAASAGDTAVSDKSIAVLPFVNMSADEENEYFSDGLSEELLNLLAKIPQLQVAARTSTFRFKGSDAGIEEIAVKLNVAHVLEGSVRKSGDQIRITAQLIKAADGFHLWSHTWDRTLTDIFAIQDEIAAAVVEALKVSLLGDIPRARVTDTEAYSLYLQAKQAANRSSPADLEQATALLTQALAIDPEYAEAWVQLGTVQTNQVGHGFVSEREGFQRALASAERALKIDPGHARALSNVGWIAMYGDWDFREAARLIGEARRLEPGSASIMNAFAVMNYAFGRRESGMALYREALTIDPFAMSVLFNLASSYSGAGRFDDADKLIDTMIEVAPESVSIPVMRGVVARARGDAEAAVDYFKQSDSLYSKWGLAMCYYDLGQDAASDAVIDELIRDDASSVFLASIHAHRGEADLAFELLDRGYEEHDQNMVEIRMYNFFDALHNDPRWDQIVQKVGMTDEVARSIGL
jgi:TolB-like protein/Flp pilus assembly protein TadD